MIQYYYSAVLGYPSNDWFIAFFDQPSRAMSVIVLVCEPFLNPFYSRTLDPSFTMLE